jgi:hypothetical protein
MTTPDDALPIETVILTNNSLGDGCGCCTYALSNCFNHEFKIHVEIRWFSIEPILV